MKRNEAPKRDRNTMAIRADRKTGKVRIQPPEGADLPDVSVRPLHELELDTTTYFRLQEVGMDSVQHSADRYMDQYLAEMQPRNPAERMLAVQMLWQHVRISHLARLAAGERGADALKVLNLAIDSAMNIYRRQTATWNALKHPRPTQFLRAGQVNMAGQQVVANGQAASPGPGLVTSVPGTGSGSGGSREASQNPVSANEQGIANASETPTPALPPLIPGLDRSPDLRGPGETLDAIHGPQDAVRQVEVESKRPQARIAVATRNRA